MSQEGQSAYKRLIICYFVGCIWPYWKWVQSHIGNTILASRVRIYLQIRAGVISTNSGFYGYLNNQQKICNASPAVILTWMEFSNNASFLKDTFHRCILSSFTREDTYIYLLLQAEKPTQRWNNTNWKDSSPDRNKSQANWIWDALLQWNEGDLKTYIGVES